MCLPPSSIDQIDREFIALLDAAEAAAVDAGWAALEPLAEAQGKVHRLEQQAARAIARHRDAIAYLHHTIVECGAERLPKRLLMSAAQYEELYGAARKRAENRLAEARRELAAFAPKAAVQLVLAPNAVESSAKTQTKPIVQAAVNVTRETDAHPLDRNATEVVAPINRGQWRLDSSGVRGRTRRSRLSLAQTIVGAPGMARGGRLSARQLRVPCHRTGAVLQQFTKAKKRMNISMDYETIGSRDRRLTSLTGRLCEQIRDNGYWATCYGGCVGSFRIELSKPVGRKRIALGQLEVNRFGPLVTTGHIPKDVKELCNKFVVP